MPRCPKLSYADDLIHVVSGPYTSFTAGSVAKKSSLGAKRTTGPYLLCSSCSVRVRVHERSTDRFHFLVNLAMNGPWTDTGIGENSSPSLLVLLPYSRVIGALTATFHRTCVSSEESEEDWQWLAAVLTVIYSMQARFTGCQNARRARAGIRGRGCAWGPPMHSQFADLVVPKRTKVRTYAANLQPDFRTTPAAQGCPATTWNLQMAPSQPRSPHLVILPSTSILPS
jgi:hypothetical protein